MPNRVSWITHQDRDILYVNCENASEDEYLQAIEESKKMIEESNTKSIRYLINTAGTTTTSRVRSKASELNTNQLPDYALRVANIGMTGVQRVIAKAIRRNMYFAGTKEEAMDWLVEQIPN